MSDKLDLKKQMNFAWDSFCRNAWLAESYRKAGLTFEYCLHDQVAKGYRHDFGILFDRLERTKHANDKV